MKYRRLGKTNLRVSVIGVGTWQFGGEWGKDFQQPEVDQMFDAARRVGINLIDTAECYGDHSSEAFIGNSVARDRGEWILASKFGHKFHGNMNRTDERSPADVTKQVHDSLKALKTDYIDILQYHSIRNNEFDNDAVGDVLMDFVRAGKVRHIGNSIGGDAMPQVEASTARHVEAIQVIYNRLDQRPESDVFPSCQRQDLGVLARVPLASGFLSGKYKPGDRFVARDYRSGQKPEELDKKLEAVHEIQQNEVPKGIPMATWALAWCLKHPAVTSVIPGCKDVAQVIENAKAADVDMVRADHPQAWKS